MNLLLLSIDCLRYDYVTPEITPNLWKLKEKGLWFEQAISCGSCTPTSFYSVFSGEYVNEEVRVKDATHPKVFRMAKSFVEEFQKAGYSTKALHSNPLMQIGGQYGFARGFDSYEYLSLVSDKIPYVLGEEMTDKALQWIGGQDRDWLLWLHYMDGHPPFLYDRQSLEFDELRQQKIHMSANYENPIISQGEHDSLIKDYIGELKYVDSQLPRLLEGLEDYLLVLWSDHGYQFGEHGRYYMGDMLYDELIRVPHLIYNPNMKKGVVAPNPYSLIHMGNDILYLCNLPTIAYGWAKQEFCKSVAMRDRGGRKYWQLSFRNAESKVIYMKEDGYTYYEKYNLKSDPEEQNMESLSNESNYSM